MSNTNIQQRAALVLQQIDAALALAEKATPGPWEATILPNSFGCVLANDDKPRQQVATVWMPSKDGVDNDYEKWAANRSFIAASRTGWPTTLRCLKTAIEGTVRRLTMTDYNPEKSDCIEILTTLCDQWEAGR